MIKYPSIEQFRNVIRHVKTHAQYAGKDANGDVIIDQSKPIPTLKFRGTTKIHGCNASIVYNADTDSFTYQSRERVLSLTSDNAGFMLAQKKYEDTIWRDVMSQVINEICVTDTINQVAVYGEWCGQGIQKGVAVAQLPRMFVAFSVKVVNAEGFTYWVPVGELDLHLPEERIFNIDTFETFEIDIDFNFPEVSQNKMIELTMEVERECPVGKYFGVSGIGEGIVWSCVTPDWTSSQTWFKTKGEKHSNSKVKTLAAVDVEAVENMRQFIEYAVTESRLEWALHNLVTEQLKPVEMSSMSDFIRTVFNDVMKEEQDTIVANGIDPKKIGSAVANVSRPWFVKKVNEGVGL